MNDDVIVIDCDAECGLVPMVMSRVAAEAAGCNILVLDPDVNHLVTGVLKSTGEDEEEARNIIVDLLQYAFEVGRHFGETGELDGEVARRKLYLEPS